MASRRRVCISLVYCTVTEVLLSWAVYWVLVVQVVVVVSAALHAAVRYCYGKSNEKPAIWSQASYGVGLRYERNSTGESKWSSGNWPEGTVSILVKELVSLWYCVNLSRFHLFHRFISGWLLVGKPGNVREFNSCQGNVKKLTKSLGSVRDKISSGFVAHFMFGAKPLLDCCRLPCGACFEDVAAAY